MMGLREIRKSRNLSQRELAQQSGVNYRSLQDYEQGHKKLSSASGDILLRLSTVLGCSIEELVVEPLPGAPILPANQLDVSTIQSQRLYCEKYQTAGRWVCQDGMVATLFYYEGQQYVLPFSAIFTEKMLPCLRAAAELQIESQIDKICLDASGFDIW